MPTQDRVWREQRAEFFESFVARDLALDGQSSSLIIVEQSPLVAKLLLEHLVLGSQILDHLLLLTIDPAGEDDEAELPRLKNEVHEHARSERE